MELYILIICLIVGLGIVFVVYDILRAMVISFFKEKMKLCAIISLLGILLIFIAHTNYYDPYISKLKLTKSQLSILGIVLVLIMPFYYIYQFLTKETYTKKIISEERERRKFIKRVRKGLSLKDAETIACKFASDHVRDKGLFVYKSMREFKDWIIYLKGQQGVYKVEIDSDGDIKNWGPVSKTEIF